MSRFEIKMPKLGESITEGTPSYSLQPTADERETVSAPVRD